MKNVISGILLCYMAMAAQMAMAQDYRDTEVFIKSLQRLQQMPVAEKAQYAPGYFNADGSPRFYVVDTICADRVEAIIRDHGLNLYAVVDTAALLSSDCDDIVSTKHAYLLLNDVSDFYCWTPKAARFNAFSDHYMQETRDYGCDLRDLVAPAADHWEDEGFGSLNRWSSYESDGYVYRDYFDKHARKYGKHSYLEYPLIAKPLCYVVLLMEGKAYNRWAYYIHDRYKLRNGNVLTSAFESVPFPDPSAYYRVLVPVFPRPEPQEAQMVCGTVVCEDGEPITCAVIEINRKYVGHTDFDGDFAIEVPGPCEITARYIGYYDKTVKVKPGQFVTVVLEERNEIEWD